MIFEIPYWKDRLHAAKTQEEFSKLLQDLPDNPTDMTSRDGQETSYTEQHPISAPFIMNIHKGNIVAG